jgi:hypothetical protein
MERKRAKVDEGRRLEKVDHDGILPELVIFLRLKKKGTGPVAGTARRVLRTTGPVPFFLSNYTLDH